VDFAATTPEWAAFALAASGGRVEWAEPAELRDVLADWSDRLGSAQQGH